MFGPSPVLLGPEKQTMNHNRIFPAAICDTFLANMRSSALISASDFWIGRFVNVDGIGSEVETGGGTELLT